MSSEQSEQCQKHRGYCIDSKLDDIINMASTEDDKFLASSTKKRKIMDDTDIVEEHLDSPSYLALKSYYSGIRLVAVRNLRIIIPRSYKLDNEPACLCYPYRFLVV